MTFDQRLLYIYHIGAVNDNSYHVLKGTSTNASAVLDGFTVRGGNSNGSGNNNKGQLGNGGTDDVVTAGAIPQLGGGIMQTNMLGTNMKISGVAAFVAWRSYYFSRQFSVRSVGRSVG